MTNEEKRRLMLATGLFMAVGYNWLVLDGTYWCVATEDIKAHGLAWGGWGKVGARLGQGVVSTEEMMETLPEELRMKLLFHLDLLVGGDDES